METPKKKLQCGTITSNGAPMRHQASKGRQAADQMPKDPIGYPWRTCSLTSDILAGEGHTGSSICQQNQNLTKYGYGYGIEYFYQVRTRTSRLLLDR
jgi:hypothetical protein